MYIDSVIILQLSDQKQDINIKKYERNKKKVEIIINEYKKQVQ